MKDKFRPQLRKIQENCQRYECVVSQNSQDFWLLRYQKVSEEKKIRNQDLIVLRNSMHQAFLSVDLFTKKLQLK